MDGTFSLAVSARSIKTALATLEDEGSDPTARAEAVRHLRTYLEYLGRRDGGWNDWHAPDEIITIPRILRTRPNPDKRWWQFWKQERVSGYLYSESGEFVPHPQH